MNGRFDRALASTALERGVEFLTSLRAQNADGNTRVIASVSVQANGSCDDELNELWLIELSESVPQPWSL